MRGILVDLNIEGHVEFLRRIWEGPGWRELWQSLRLPIHTWADLELPAETTDVVLWRLCQRDEFAFLPPTGIRTAPILWKRPSEMRTRRRSFPCSHSPTRS